MNPVGFQASSFTAVKTEESLFLTGSEYLGAKAPLSLPCKIQCPGYTPGQSRGTTCHRCSPARARVAGWPHVGHTNETETLTARSSHKRQRFQVSEQELAAGYPHPIYNRFKLILERDSKSLLNSYM